MLIERNNGEATVLQVVNFINSKLKFVYPKNSFLTPAPKHLPSIQI